MPADAGSAFQPDSRRLWGFVLLIGLTSLFADMTYEGSRSLIGPFLGSLGARAAWVATIAGAGELFGYGLRWWSGRLADRTQRYWTLTLAGYALNLLAVPALALAGTWGVAAALIVLERVGKAIRTPARDAMLAHAGQSLGRSGWAFGVHEAMDQTGATLGPLLVAGLVGWHGHYATAFAWLAVPATTALTLLVLARFRYPHPQHLASAKATPQVPPGRSDLHRFLLAAALIAAGYADFPLLAFHLARHHVLADSQVPALYALGNVMAGAAALWLGRAYDRAGLRVLLHASVVPALFAPLVIFGGPIEVLLGMALWGIGFGAHDTLLRAAVADRVAPAERASVLGAFNAVYGLAWFGGSVVLGLLYDVAPAALVVASLALQWSGCLLLRRLPAPISTSSD